MVNETSEVVDALDDAIMFAQAEEIFELDTAAKNELMGIENLKSIKASIEAHGITATAEDLVVPSLEAHGIDMSEAEVACEGIMDTAKAALRRVWEFILKVVAKIKDFFAKRFGKFVGYYKALKKREKDLATKEPKFEQDGKAITVAKDSYKEATISAIASDGVGGLEVTVKGIESLVTDELKTTPSAADNQFSLTVSNEDGVVNYEFEEDFDTYLEGDLTIEAISGNKDKYKTNVTGIMNVCKLLSSGKFNGKVEKAYAKLSQKIDKEAKKDSYGEDAKNDAANMRSGIKVSRKMMSAGLKMYAQAATSLLAVKIAKV